MAQASKLTLVVAGGGKIDVDHAADLLIDKLGAYSDWEVILPMAPEFFTPAVEMAADLLANGAEPQPFIAVTDSHSADDKKIAAFLDKASRVIEVENVGMKIVALLQRAEGDRALVFAVDEDSPALTAAERVADVGIPVLDLCSNLDELTTGDDNAPAAADQSGPDDEEGGWNPTEAELTAMDIDGEGGLKAICADNGIEVAPRSRKPTYVKAILAALGAVPSQDGGDEEPAEASPSRVPSTGGSLEAVTAAILGGVTDAVRSAMDGPTFNIGQLDKKVSALAAAVEALTNAIEALSTQNAKSSVSEPAAEANGAPKPGGLRRLAKRA